MIQYRYITYSQEHLIVFESYCIHMGLQTNKNQRIHNPMGLFYQANQEIKQQLMAFLSAVLTHPADQELTKKSIT